MSALAWTEAPVVIESGPNRLVGVVARPAGRASHAVLIVVGGPQYRAGSHRQFTLLARSLAEDGIASLRFDYAGMGDSEGDPTDFEGAGPDLAAAMDALCAAVGPGVRPVIWGLCDAASAALLYAWRDDRVSGLVLLNPWVRTAQTEARAYLKHYYARRLLDRAFWRKALNGEVDWSGSARGLAARVGAVLGRRAAGTQGGGEDVFAPDRPLPDRMLAGWQRFPGPVLLILSGNDLTAREFVDVTRASPGWRVALDDARVTVHELAEATHTFSSAPWRNAVARWTAEWTVAASAHARPGRASSAGADRPRVAQEG